MNQFSMRAGSWLFSMRAGLWLRQEGRPWALDWHKQISCLQLDFLIPWRLVQWQPPLRHRRAMPPGAAPLNLISRQAMLYGLAERSTNELFIPDGVIPYCLPALLTELGCPKNAVTAVLQRLVACQLHAVVRASQLHLLWVAQLWQNLGSPMRGFGPTDLRLSVCNLCGLQCSRLFLIPASEASTGDALIEHSIVDHLHQLGLERPASAAALQVRNLLQVVIRAQQNGHLTDTKLCSHWALFLSTIHHLTHIRGLSREVTVTSSMS
jgi:hypothetical protein